MIVDSPKIEFSILFYRVLIICVHIAKVLKTHYYVEKMFVGVLHALPASWCVTAMRQLVAMVMVTLP